MRPIEAEIHRELAEGRSWERAELSRDEARARFEAEGEPYKVELVDTAAGDIEFDGVTGRDNRVTMPTIFLRNDGAVFIRHRLE